MRKRTKPLGERVQIENHVMHPEKQCSLKATCYFERLAIHSPSTSKLFESLRRKRKRESSLGSAACGNRSSVLGGNRPLSHKQTHVLIILLEREQQIWITFCFSAMITPLMPTLHGLRDWITVKPIHSQFLCTNTGCLESFRTFDWAARQIQRAELGLDTSVPSSFFHRIIPMEGI